MVVKVHCGTVQGDKFAAMLKMRPSKQSRNALDDHLDPVSRATSKWRIDPYINENPMPHSYYSQFSLRRTPSGPALSVHLREMSVDRESNKGNKQRQGPTLGVRFTGVSVKRESTVHCFVPPHLQCSYSKHLQVNPVM